MFLFQNTPKLTECGSDSVLMVHSDVIIRFRRMLISVFRLTR